MKKLSVLGICVAMIFLYGCIGGICLADRSYSIVVLPEDEVPGIAEMENDDAERERPVSKKVRLRGYDADSATYQYVYYGKFEQTRSAQPLLWRVLMVEGNDALLLSERILATRPFGKSSEWERSDIKKWLNSSFIKSAFSAKERNAIYDSESLGQVFILSADELRNPDYGFSTKEKQKDKQRCAKGTMIAIDEGLFVNDDNRCSTYYARSALNRKNVNSVTSEGIIGIVTLDRKDLGIRPAMWVDLSKISFSEGDGSAEDPYR